MFKFSHLTISESHSLSQSTDLEGLAVAGLAEVGIEHLAHHNLLVCLHDADVGSLLHQSLHLEAELVALRIH